MTDYELARALAKAEELIQASDRGLLHSGMKDVVLLARAHVLLTKKLRVMEQY